MPVRPSLVTAVLLLAVLGVSLSGPLVRLSGAPAIAIATWRLGFSLVIIAVPLIVGGSWRQWRRLTRTDLALALLGGVLLALHFWSWNTSIAWTTIAASVVLVNVQPLVVAALSAWWLHEAPTRQQWIGISVAMLGALVVVLPDLRGSDAALSDGRAVIGDALAVAGAVTAAGYYVIGRRLRAGLDLWSYTALVYGACFVTLLAIAAATATPLGPYPPREIGIFAGLALGPMLLGHTGLNWALRHARAYQVNIVLLGEPVGATMLAALLPGIRELPGIFTIAGGAIVLVGILLAERRRS
ncbi:MAG TPA: DMT family transporter [Gemmatimonadaceae bacterium]|nr:DMT family transporter [Gemmatimonadaceae bacterium]